MKGGRLANYGGLGMCVLQLVSGLRERGVDVDVLSRKNGTSEGEVVSNVTRTPYIRLTKSRNWKLTHGFTLMPTLIKMMLKKNYDIVHVHNPPAGITAIPTSHAFKKKVVMTMHGPWARVRDRFKSLAMRIENDTLFGSDYVTFDSESLLEMYGHKGNYYAIRNAVDSELFKPLGMDEARDKFGLEHDRRIFLYSGRNVYGKNVDVIRMVAGDFPNDRFIVTGWRGDAIDEEFSNVRYMKSIPNYDMPALYSACNGMILASSMEGLSRAVLETMSCERAAILSDIPANHEAALGIGRYFRSSDELKEILEGTSVKDMEKMGKDGRKRAIKEFSVSRRIESFLKLYEKI